MSLLNCQQPPTATGLLRVRVQHCSATAQQCSVDNVNHIRSHVSDFSSQTLIVLQTVT